MMINILLSANKFAELNKIFPVVIRVHGQNHPELNKVGEIYTKLLNNDNIEEMKKLILEMNNITNGFIVPNDACSTFARTYSLLLELKNAILDL